MTRHDGGPAFPAFSLERVYRSDEDSIGEQQYVPTGGMTLRDYFATHAMLATLTRAPELKSPVHARWAYEMADAMLAERDAE